MCFVISLCFYTYKLPGKHIIFAEPVQPRNEIRKELYLNKNDGPFRISTFYKSKGTDTSYPIFNFIIKQSKKTILHDELNTNNGSGGRDGSIYWGYNNYGLFEIPEDGNYELIFQSGSYPKDFITLNLIVSKHSSNLWRNMFIFIGTVFFLIFAFKARKAKIKFKRPRKLTTGCR